jgi:hypothetical protein
MTPARQQARARHGAWLRKHDLLLAPVTPTAKSLNTSHPSLACDAASLAATGGAGLLYCFAAD